jgi:hypothetical protein
MNCDIIKMFYNLKTPQVIEYIFCSEGTTFKHW